MLSTLILSIVLLQSQAERIATQPAPPSSTRPAMVFEKYQLVILPAGDPKQTASSSGMDIQEKHLAHLRQLADEGKMVIAGPFSDQQDKSMRGMCLYRVGSIEEARKLAEEDPAVKAGRLKVEVLTWNVAKGYMTFPKAPTSTAEQP